MHKELAAWLATLERKVVGHDADIRKIFTVLHRLMNPPAEPAKRIGFKI